MTLESVKYALYVNNYLYHSSAVIPIYLYYMFSIKALSFMQDKEIREVRVV